MTLAAKLTGKAVLITGGTGFVGANLVRVLTSAGIVPHLLIRPDANLWRLRDVAPSVVFHHGNLTDEGALEKVVEKVRPDFLFHLAVPRGSDEGARDEMLRVNVLGASSLIRLTRIFGISRVIVAGSSLEFGSSLFALREDSALSPQTWHGATKAAAYLLFQQAVLAEALPITVLRLFHIYGPWESGHRLAPTTIRAALYNQPLDLTGPGIRRDWIFIEDVVEALLRVADVDNVPMVFNIGTGKETTNEEFVSQVEAVTQRSICTAYGAYTPRLTDTAHRYADPSLAARFLGWKARHDIADGILRTLQWLEDYPQAWDCEKGHRPEVI